MYELFFVLPSCDALLIVKLVLLDMRALQSERISEASFRMSLSAKLEHVVASWWRVDGDG